MIKWCIMKSVLVIIFVVTSSFSFAKWEPCNNSYFDSNIRFFESNGKVILAVLNNSIYISTDNAESWIDKTIGEYTYPTSSVFVGDNIFVGTSFGVYFSSNNGSNWVTRSNGITSMRILSMTVSGINIFIATEDGIFVSSDNGNNWVLRSKGSINGEVKSLKALGSNLYAITQNSFYHSSDNGNTWVIKNNGLNIKSLREISLIKSEIFVSTIEGLYFSNDHGNNWKEIYPKSDIYGLSVSNELVVFFDGSTVFISSDRGKNWVTKKKAVFDHVNLASYNKDNLIIVGNYFGKIFKSSDQGDNWILTNNNLIKSKVSELAKAGQRLIAATSNGIFTSSNNGDVWHPQNAGIYKSSILALAVKDDLLFSVTGTGIFKSNTGSYWNQMFYYSSINNDHFKALTTDGKNLISATLKGKLYKSTNNGINWDRCQNVFDENVLSLCYDNDFLYAGTTDGFFISTNHGESFSDYSNGLTSKIINSIHVANGIIFAGTGGGGVFSSSDGGNTWISKQNGLKSQYIRGFCSYGNFIFAASIDGVFMSSDKGENWIEINDNLTNKNVYSVIVSGDYLFAGTSDDGIFRTKLSDYGISGLNDFSQKTLSISPNPASDFIKIQFINKELKPFVTNYKIQIFDMLGVEVISTFAPPNEENLRIDVSHLPAGVYVIRIGDKVEKFVKM